MKNKTEQMLEQIQEEVISIHLLVFVFGLALLMALEETIFWTILFGLAGLFFAILYLMRLIKK